MKREHEKNEINRNRRKDVRPFCIISVISYSLIILTSVLYVRGVARAQQTESPKRVLVLYWYDKDYPGHITFDRSFQATLGSAPAGTVEYYPEYLESNRFPGESQSLSLRDHLRQKYADHKIDVIVAATDASLEFFLKYRNDLFPHTPIVFEGVKGPPETELTAGPGITGIRLVTTYRETIDLAMRLHPGTEQVFIISGTLQHDKKFEILARTKLQGYENKLRVNYLTDLPSDELIAKTKSLPERSIILYAWQQSYNGQGKVLESREILAMISRSTRVPIYGMAGANIGEGIIGGYAYTTEALATRTAEIVLRIVSGVRAQDIPVENMRTIPMFDWHELRRWGISENRLPAESVVLFKELSFWKTYKWRIIGIISLCIIQAGLIAVLLIERGRRRRAREALDDRLRFETLLSDLSADFTDLRHDEADRKIKMWLNRIVQFLGVDRGHFFKALMVGEKVHHPHSYSVPGTDPTPEIDLQQEMPWYVEQLRRGTVLNYSRLPDQLPVEATAESQQFRDAGLKSHLAIPVLLGGSAVYALSFTTLLLPRSWSEDLVVRLRLVGEIFANALMRKQAEEDLLESHARIEYLAGRLIVAQEDERKRIARELHDDFNQQLAALAIGLDRLERQLPDAEDTIRKHLIKLEGRTNQLVERVRCLSHELHSSTLEHVGLPEALKRHCAEFAEQEGISVNLNIQDGNIAIPADAALCIYRVAQEALRNIARHSGAKIAEVMLCTTRNILELRVADQGMGFNKDHVRLRRGLGLVSIEERVKLLHGSFEVKSQSGAGTELRVHLPLKNEQGSIVLNP